MCNLYATAKSADLIAQAFPEKLRDLAGNEPWAEDVYPDRTAPIIRHDGADLAIARARWGMPTPQFYLASKRSDPGVTNIRNLSSSHWQRWLGVAHRCLVPFTAFSEPDVRSKQPVWFGLGSRHPIGFFAGIRTEWNSVRKVKEGEVTAELFGFRTCAPNQKVGAVHPKGI